MIWPTSRLISETPEPPGSGFIFPPTWNREVSPLVKEVRCHSKYLLLLGIWLLGFPIGPKALLKRPVLYIVRARQFSLAAAAVYQPSRAMSYRDRALVHFFEVASFSPPVSPPHYFRKA